MRRLHAAHQGETRTAALARRSVWWLGRLHDLAQTVHRCSPCQESRPSHTHQPKLLTDDAGMPMVHWHVDLFQCGGINFIVAVDEFTFWPYVAQLGTNITASLVIKALPTFIDSHGAPTCLRTDGGPQLVASETRAWLAKWGVTHLPRSNGTAEAAVKIIKQIITGAAKQHGGGPDWSEVFAGLIAFPNTPRAGGTSPAQLKLGRDLRGPIPSTPASRALDVNRLALAEQASAQTGHPPVL
jgi:hypothetical protein